MSTVTNKDYSPSMEDFASLLAESLAKDDLYEGSVVKGKIVSIVKDMAVIDVGLKMEGRVAVKEFSSPGEPDVKVGDTIDEIARGPLSMSDTMAFVIASGRSDTQVRAIAEAVETAGRARGRRPLWVEGLSHGQWVLLDYGDIVVHVFFGPVREFYDLERLWSKAPRVEMAETKASDGSVQEAAR